MKQKNIYGRLIVLLLMGSAFAASSSFAKSPKKDKLDLDSAYDPSLGFNPNRKSVVPDVEDSKTPTAKKATKKNATNATAKLKTPAKTATKRAKGPSTPAPAMAGPAAALAAPVAAQPTLKVPTKIKKPATSMAKAPAIRSKAKDSTDQMIKPKFAGRKSKSSAPVAINRSVESRIADLKTRYRSGDLNDRRMWQELAAFSTQDQSISQQTRAEILQTQAYLVKEAGYPILSAQFAAAALTTAANPLQKEMLPTWSTLAAVAKTRSVQDTLIGLAGTLDLTGVKVPEFGNDWYYFVGNAADRRGEKERALNAYSRLAISDRYFMPARYQLAMIQLERNHHKDAEAALKSILYPETTAFSPLKGQTKTDIENYSKLALARISYERQDFLEAIRMYRLVDRDSPLFYDALFEQSWAFFMGGYPNHALGSLFSVESPFFAQEFNPEATMLRAVAQYWLCRYDDSRGALADFMDHHSKAVEAVSAFLERKQLREETAYQLFENFITGVSEEALGIPKAILDTAARKDSMLLVRDEYAAAIAERERLVSKGIFGSKDNLSRSLEFSGGVVDGLRRDLGSTYLEELKALKEQYDQLYAQAKFLYLELLMSEKEQLLGRELHASTKITQVDMRRDVAGWGRKLQSWGPSDKGEFWWDEVGFYISRVEPMCNVR